MRVFVTEDGDRYEVRDARTLIRKMRVASPYQEHNQLAWMETMSHRIYQTSRTRVSTQSGEADFVKGLLRSGLVTEEKSNATKQLLVVYGTLKQGYHNSHRLRNARYLGEVVSASTNYKMASIGFPILWEIGKETNTSAAFVGELYEVDNNTLRSCDQLEGHPHMYERKLRMFYCMTKQVRAWVYIWNRKIPAYAKPINPEYLTDTDSNQKLYWPTDEKEHP